MTRAKGGSDEHPVDKPEETPEETPGSTPVDTSVDGHGIVADLRRVTGALAAAESRPGQERMASAVATAITRKRHLIVQAGTGTGKSAAYLVPAIQAATHGATGSSEGGQGKPVIIVTASKALQDQLAVKDLPFIAEHLGTPFDYAVLKGRSNYLCMQRVNEHIAAARGSSKNQAQGQLDLEELAPAVKLEVKKLTQWSARTESGDQSELDWAPSDKAWSEVSVGSEECPGANRCPAGQECFAENARAKATMADVVVVNTFLYGLDVASDGAILPDHDVVIFDEAHQLEDVMSDTVGVSIGPGRFTKVAQALRRVLEDPQVVGGVADASLILREALSDEAGNRLSNPLPSGISKALVAGRNRLEKAANALRGIETTVDDAKQRLLRAQTLIIRLTENIDAALSYGTQYVAFVSGGPEMPRLEIAPLDVGPVMSKSVWSKRTAVLTSATVPSSLAERVGLPAATTDQLDVGSPFDYEHNGMLYCAVELPDPRQPAYAAAMHAELIALIEAAGGRTLALFTSWKAMDEAAEAVKRGLAGKGGEPKFPVLTQRDLPKPALIKAFSEDPSSCLFATAGFFQGVDIPGDTLTLVTIDKIPFPRPDDPLLSARREKLGPAAFGAIDIPRAAMLLAQAAGRLIRTATDRGVVAVFDNRLGKANYRWDLVRALPPMKRTRHRSEAEDFLRELAG
jgi:ATP-dependent DNA helicase DinG